MIASPRSLLTCCSLEPDNRDSPVGGSNLGMDLVKLPVTAPTSGLSDQCDQPLTDTFILPRSSSSSRDLKNLEEKHKWLQRRRSLALQQKSDDLPSEHGENNKHSLQQSKLTVSKDQRHPSCSPETATKRTRIKLPLKTQTASRLPADKDMGYLKGRPALIPQDVEGGYASGDLVQVRIAHISDSGSWMGALPSRGMLENSKLLGDQFSRSWAGSIQNSGVP